jgi:uncharacterized membrane protein YgcG
MGFCMLAGVGVGTDSPRKQSKPRQTTCSGCGAPLSLTGTCSYCRRRASDEEEAERRSVDSYTWSTAVDTALDAIASVAADAFSSGGGGDFGGGGASGDW